VHAITSSSRAKAERIHDLIAWHDAPADNWHRGFLAGIFDAEGHYSPKGILRIYNTDEDIISRVTASLDRFNFENVVETRKGKNKPVYVVRVRGGLTEHLRFFLAVDPAISRKRTIAGAAVKSSIRLRVKSVEPIGLRIPMYDMTTGTGDFIADGVINHNCYARPSHQYLGLGAGTDFDRKLVVKTNAPELLRAAFDKKSWTGERVMFSGITDCYQPLEVSYQLTRRCLEVCAAYSNPISVITKSMVIRRDVELLARLAREAGARVALSIPFADDAMARKIEPNASPPSRRFETMKLLADAGVPVTLALAPVIPGLNDPDIPELLERARDAGARAAFLTLVRLPAEVRPVFQERIRATLAPERVRKIEHAIVELRGGTGKMNESNFGARFSGVGERWKAIEAMFDLHCKRLGINVDEDEEERPSTFRRPGGPQLSLF
jgi:DNA repair photolyase